MTIRADGEGGTLPSLDARFSRNEVSMALTMCGLLVEKAEQLSRLYTRHRDWTVVEERWETERYDDRSTRDSSKKIYRVLSSRFKTARSNLPAITKLPSIFDQCTNHRDKAQVLYFYLLEDDPLVKYTVHQYASRMRQTGVGGLDFEQETVERLLNEFHYDDGSEFDYAESTTRRWGEGLRSVMREIDVLENQQADDEIVFPPKHWAATFRSHAQLILHELGEYLGYSPPSLLERLIEDAQKIHQQRPILQETLATAT